jgi:hypothetical protein
LPRDDWGPMKSVNHYGLYKHLNEVESIDEIDFDLTRSSIVTRGDNEYFEENLYEKYMKKLDQESP